MKGGKIMSTIITGIVTNGVVVTSTVLPEGAGVEVHLQSPGSAVPASGGHSITPSELRKLPRHERQTILAAAAALAEQDYREDKELTGFEAFSEEELDGDETDSH
jgi:hypothetical protein